MKLTEDELELFELAYLLKIPLYKLMDEMPYDELLGWGEYFNLKPPGWREDQRAALIVNSNGANVAGEHMFSSLARMKEISEKEDADKVNTKGLTQSAFMQNMLKAVGGDRIPTNS